MKRQPALTQQDPAQHEHTPNNTPGANDDYYRRALHQLIDIGVELAQVLHRETKRLIEPNGPPQADASAPGTPHPDDALRPMPPLPYLPTLAFERLSLAIRRTILLARSLDQPVKPTTPRPDRVANRVQVIRAIEDSIQREAHGDAAQTLHAELVERLEQPEFLRELDTRPIDDVIEDIRHDLALGNPPGTRPHKRRTPAECAILHARAAAPPGAAAHPSLTIFWPKPPRPTRPLPPPIPQNTSPRSSPAPGPAASNPPHPPAEPQLPENHPKPTPPPSHPGTADPPACAAPLASRPPSL